MWKSNENSWAVSFGLPELTINYWIDYKFLAVGLSLFLEL